MDRERTPGARPGAGPLLVAHELPVTRPPGAPVARRPATVPPATTAPTAAPPAHPRLRRPRLIAAGGLAEQLENATGVDLLKARRPDTPSGDDGAT